MIISSISCINVTFWENFGKCLENFVVFPIFHENVMRKIYKKFCDYSIFAYRIIWINKSGKSVDLLKQMKQCVKNELIFHFLPYFFRGKTVMFLETCFLHKGFLTVYILRIFTTASFFPYTYVLYCLSLKKELDVIFKINDFL